MRHISRPIWLLLLLAVLLRLPLLGGSFWLDEAAQVLESSRPFFQQLNISNDFQPPLIHYLVHFSLKVGQSEWWLRMVAALIPGIITIAFTYKIAERFFSTKAAVVAGLVLSTSSYHIFYSQELRPYSLPAMFAVISWWLLLRKDFNRPLILFIYFLTTVAGMFSSYLFGFSLVAQLLGVILFHRSKLARMIWIWFLAGLASSWWLRYFLEQLMVGQSWRKDLPGWDQVVSLTQLKAIPLTLGKFWFGVLDLEINGLFGLLTLLIVTGFLWGSWQLKSNRKFLTIFIWFWLPLLLGWLISFWVPVVRPKRLLFLLPAWSIMVGVIYDRLSSAKVKWQQVLVQGWVVLLLGINLFSVASYWQQPKLQRENWRALIARIEVDYPAYNSIAVFSFPAEFAPWAWYADPAYPKLSTAALHVSMVPDLSASLSSVIEYRHVLVFDYLRDLTDPNDQVLHTIQDLGYSQVDVIDYENIGFVRVFMRQNDLISLE